MRRYREISVAEMNLAQTAVHDQIIAGKRGRFGGPFQLMIRAPEICKYAAPLGETLRWGTTLPPRLSELAICITAKFWRAQYDWYADAALAVQARVLAPDGLVISARGSHRRISDVLKRTVHMRSR